MYDKNAVEKNRWMIDPDAMDFAQIMVDEIVPPYRGLMESYDKAQDVQKVGHQTRLDLMQQGKDKSPAGPA